MRRDGYVTAAKKKGPWRSGFCGHDLPPESHARCHGVYINRPCVCDCHQEKPVLTAHDDSKQGFHDNIPEAAYHADRESLSVSGAKVLLKAPALFKWQQDHPVHKDVFDIGSAAHRLVLGVGPDVLVCPFDSWRTNEAKAMRDDARQRGEIPVLKADWERVTEMADVLSRHRMAMSLLSGGKAEVSAYALDEETGVMRRCRYDYLRDDLAVDYKSAASSEPTAFARAAASFGYHMQHPYYYDIGIDLGLPLKGFVFIVQMKEPPYLVSVVELVPDAVERGRDLNRQALQRFRDCREVDLWQGYARDDEITPIDIPRWAYYDQESA